MEAVYPTSASALARGRRMRRREPRERRRTMPVTFAEIKEVDEEGAGGSSEEVARGRSVAEERRRRVDVVAGDERLGEFRRRRAPAALRELSPPDSPPVVARAFSEPDALHRHEAPRPPVCTNTAPDT